MGIKNFGEKLKVARLDKNISQRGLGLALGLSDKTISSYESSRSYPNLELLPKISEILEKPIEYFVSDGKDILLNEKLESIIGNHKKISEELVKIKAVINKGE
ncbi:helix-turn-helix transcriptional regulator [Candidatus Dojkabacteria bacterium]|jgi:transcriptional regulator with XRE-family HTH domain|uniref:Helix-turn-helix transcriptional regulator n=1 Tax=Candidatus Dojkabacteria bacterium TaxID=2099670 RepID=A0A847ESQ7_9BACT|nr:helix-turn-helix transcriptional regulator [Candidatus Dojkabacteria bacterium]